jgi:hypothetical protein
MASSMFALAHALWKFLEVNEVPVSRISCYLPNIDMLNSDFIIAWCCALINFGNDGICSVLIEYN